MHSQQLIAEVKNNLYSDPQKCIKILSNKTFLNNIFEQQLEQLTNILQSTLQKMNKENRNISFAGAQIQNDKSQQLNAQLIVCMYSIIIMKSTAKSIIVAQQQPIFSTKLAIDILNKIYKQSKQEQVRKIVAALLLKVPNFSNHKNIVKDLDPKFISMKTIEKACSTFRTQCPNLFQQKINSYKQTEWSKLLAYKPFKLDLFAETLKKLQTIGLNASDANALVQIRQQIGVQFNFLMRRIKLIQNEQFFIYQFCQKFSQLFKLKLQFPKLVSSQRFNDTKTQFNPASKTLPNYNLNELRLKIFLEAKNYLLIILNSLISKLSSYWTRKIKWLYDFIIERIEIYGLEDMAITTIQEPEVYIEKLTELKLTIKLCHTYYRQFGDGLFPQQKLKAVLFTQEFSLYKMIQAILYNEYEFVWKSQSSRIVNYQKNKKITEQVKNKQSLIKMVNINSKSLNINPHYDLVFQKIIHEITYKQGSSYSQLRALIFEALRFMNSFYKKSQTYFYGGNLITMIENCKNAQIPRHKIFQILKDIKTTLYPYKKMTKQGLQFFCEEVFESYISKRKALQTPEKKDSQNFKICKTNYLTIHSDQNDQRQIHGTNYSNNFKIEPSPKEQSRGIRKTKSYDMVIEGWGNDQNLNPSAYSNSNSIPIRNQGGSQAHQSQIFYSIKQCSVKDQNDTEKQPEQNLQIANSKFESIKQNQPAGDQDEFILTPQF